MAGDLRMVSAALKMTTDMERIGNHATNIAQWAIFAMTGEMPKDWGNSFSLAALDSSLKEGAPFGKDKRLFGITDLSFYKGRLKLSPPRCGFRW